MATPQILFGVIAVLLCCSALFSASETALFSIPRERYVFFERAGNRSSRLVYQLLLHGQRTLLMILLGNLFVNITLAGVIHTLMKTLFAGAAILPTMIAATTTIIIFGELLPKNIALRYNEKIAGLIAPLLSGLVYICLPVLTVMHRINGFFLLRLRIRLRRPSPFVTVEELRSGVIASRKSGAISGEEQDVIVGLLDRGIKPVRHFMHHRLELILVPDGTPVHKALTGMHGARQPFLLVYEKNTTVRVAGMVHCGALLRSAPNGTVNDLMQPLQWVPETMEIAEAIVVLLEKGCNEAGVVDEFGAFSGVLSLSAGVSRIVQPLITSGEPKTERYPGRSRIFSGSATVDTLSGWLPPSLKEGALKVRTLNGLLTTWRGAIPQAGDKFAIDGWNFYILSADPRMIRSVLIRKKESV